MTVYVLVEGQTEESFVKNSLKFYLQQYGIYIIPIVVSTKRVLSGTKTVGGLSNGNLSRFLDELNRLLHSLPEGGIVTTFIDYYALPANFPGVENLDDALNKDQKVEIIQESLHAYYQGHRSLIPYVQMHEFESLLFSHPRGFQEYLDPAKGDVNALLSIIDQYENPEDINNRKETSPSHRLLAHYPDYNKHLLGNMIALEIGIDHILSKCPRFKNWIETIISKKQ
jgi:hypothetical protein